MALPTSAISPSSQPAIAAPLSHDNSAPSLLHSIGRFFSAPLRWVGGAVMEGMEERGIEVIERDRPQFTDQLQGTISDTLLRRAPLEWAQSQELIQSFLQQPSLSGLQELSHHLISHPLTADSLLNPMLNESGRSRISSLLTAIEEQITDNEDVFTDAPEEENSDSDNDSFVSASEEVARFTVSEDLTQHLYEVHHILSSAIERHQGSLLSTMDFIRNSLFEQNRGILDQGEARINRILQSLEQLPARMAAQFLPTPSQEPVPPTPTSTNTSESGEDPVEVVDGNRFLPFNAILTRSRALLGQIIQFGSEAIAAQSASSLATMMLFIFEKIKSHLIANPEYPQVLAVIAPLIERIKATQDSGSWSELFTTLQESVRVMQDNQVYLQGIKIPLNPVRTHVSAIPQFLTNISTHQALLQKKHPLSEKISPEMIEKEAQKLETRMSAFFPMKWIGQSICGFGNDESFYIKLLELPEAASIDNYNELLRSQFFTKIDQSDLVLIQKWAAKGLYYLLAPICSFTANVFIRNVLSKFQEWKNQPPKELRQQAVSVVDNLCDWLATLSSSYNQAAETPPLRTKALNIMLEEAIEAPERNRGLSKSELYTYTSQIAWDVFGPKVEWRRQIESYFEREFEASSFLSFLNPVIRGLNWVLSRSLSLCVFAPEWILNQALQLGKNFFLRQTPLLEGQINKLIFSLNERTPTSFAFKKLLYHQLQRIQVKLQESLAEDTPSLIEEGTDQEIKISQFVEYLFEILNKSRCHTQDRLRDLREGRVSAKERLENEIDNIFLPEILETAVKTISISLETLIQEEGLDEIAFNALLIANDSFEPQPNVSDEEFAVVQKGIREVTEQILEAAIFYALTDRIDFSGEKQKRAVREFFESLKTETNQFIDKVTGVIPSDPINLDLDHSATFTKMVDDSSTFQQSRVQAISRADGNRYLHTEIKQKMNEISGELASKCTHLGALLNRSVNLEKELTKEKKIRALYERIQTLTQTIEGFVYPAAPSSEQYRLAKIQYDMLVTALSEIGPLIAVSNLAVLNTQSQAISTQLDALHPYAEDLKIYGECTILFETLKNEKMTCLTAASPPQSLRDKERILLAKINSLSRPQDQSSLREKTLALMLATSSTALSSASTGFITHLSQLIITTSSLRSHSQLQIHQAKEYLTSIAATSRQNALREVEEKSRALQETLTQARTAAEELRAWANELNNIPIWNLFIFDMQWVTEITQNLAFDRAKVKVDQLMEALYKKHNHRGILHHVALLPFLEEHAPELLK